MEESFKKTRHKNTQEKKGMEWDGGGGFSLLFSYD